MIELALLAPKPQTIRVIDQNGAPVAGLRSSLTIEIGRRNWITTADIDEAVIETNVARRSRGPLAAGKFHRSWSLRSLRTVEAGRGGEPKSHEQARRRDRDRPRSESSPGDGSIDPAVRRSARREFSFPAEERAVIPIALPFRSRVCERMERSRSWPLRATRIALRSQIRNGSLIRGSTSL